MEIKYCKIHGSVRHFQRSEGGWRCSKCASYSVMNRRRKVKAMAVAFAGGKCKKCGYNKCLAALDFHHKDPSKKDFGLSVRGLTKGWKFIKAEIKKCVLLCANCHREEHDSEVA